MKRTVNSYVILLTLFLLCIDNLNEAGKKFGKNFAQRKWMRRRLGLNAGASRRQIPVAWDESEELHPGPLNDSESFPFDSGHPTASPRRFYEQCQTDCLLKVSNYHQARARIEDLTDDIRSRPFAHLIHFTVKFIDYDLPVMESYPYMEDSWRASEWLWTSSGYGNHLLGLPMDADVLSLYLLDRRWTAVDVEIKSTPERCFLLHSAECRLHEIRKLLISNLTAPSQSASYQSSEARIGTGSSNRGYLCHQVVNQSLDKINERSELMYRCCKIKDFQMGDVSCRTYIRQGEQMAVLSIVIFVIAIVVTLISPLILLKIKMALKFDSVTKFFRASLKHGITGQRNYVIRISSRQLINLSDPRPFSLPRAMFRLIFHCYGEGRCCIHWWCEWSEQPKVCRKASTCRKCWFVSCKIFAVLFIYPVILHIAVALYAPKLSRYHSVVNHTIASDAFGTVRLNVNPIAGALIPAHDIIMSLWCLFSFASFIYIVVLLSWSDNPLERCLLRHEGGKRTREQPNVLHRRLLHKYKHVLQRLAYGEHRTKRHFFRIPWCPWGAYRVLRLIGRILLQVPVLHICAATFLYDMKLCGYDEDNESSSTVDRDEAADSLKLPVLISIKTLCNRCLSVILWLGFTLLLSGYCTSIFLMIVFLLNVIFFVSLGALLYASVFLPWIAIAAVLLFYTNDVLTAINSEHCYILKLIDENSPRISATEETEEESFRETGGGIQILKSHNLGAVKFIDGDNTEYVSKELYYNVCADLKQGWTVVIRRIFQRISFISILSLFLFTTLQNLCLITGGSEFLYILFGLAVSTLPKLFEIHWKSIDPRPDPRTVWARLIPDILDRHIRVDRTGCVDEAEEALATYDVRPIGIMDMDLPRPRILRTLHLWKFPWIVSGDQQTQSTESFVIALANKLAAASVLTRVIMRGYSLDLNDDFVLRQWCQMVENCILESSSTATALGLSSPMDSVSLFSREVHDLVTPFDAGSTIDQAVDEINRQLYGPFTRGVLVTVGNTSCAILKSMADNRLIAFNASCHGDQMTDIYGAVVIVTEFNTQNLQLMLKFLIDPIRPDGVPVYSIVPVEAFMFRTPEIYDIESSI